MPIVFDEVVGTIEPDPRPTPQAEPTPSAEPSPAVAFRTLRLLLRRRQERIERIRAD